MIMTPRLFLTASVFCLLAMYLGSRSVIETINNPRDAWDTKGIAPEKVRVLQRTIETSLLAQQEARLFPDTVDVEGQQTADSLEMRLVTATRSITTQETPNEKTLRAFFTRHQEAYREAAVLTLKQVLYSSAVHGGSATEIARNALAASAQGVVPEGDQSSLQDHYTEISSIALGHLMGEPAAEAIVHLARQNNQLPCWTGPLRSSYGVHLVCVEHFTLGSVPAFEDVQLQVLNDWRYAITQDRSRETLQPGSNIPAKRQAIQSAP